MKKQIKSLLCGLCAAALALGCAGCSDSAGPEVPAKVTNIMVWTYYNGDQLESFTRLVEQFNETVGAQKARRCSAVMPWQTICWWAHSSWATPSLR